MNHLNNNVMAAVSIKTTGPVPAQNDIIQIGIVIVDNFLRPESEVMPFYFDIQPLRKENLDIAETAKAIKISQQRLINIIGKGIDPFLCADRLDEWVERLNLRFRKRLIPICYNWAKIRPFLIQWLQPTAFSAIFDDEARDVLQITSFANDVANWHADSAPYPKRNFAYICSELEITRDRNLDCLQECGVLIEIYKRILTNQF